MYTLHAQAMAEVPRNQPDHSPYPSLPLDEQPLLEEVPQNLPRKTVLHAMTARVMGRNKEKKSLSTPSTSQPLLRESSQLCGNCQQIMWRIEVEWKTFQYPHYSSERELEESSERGCAMCYQFCFSHHRDRDSLHPPGTIEVSAHQSNVAFITLYTERSGHFFLSHKLLLKFSRSEALEYDSEHPTTRDALVVCKQWLKECRETHSNCRSSRNLLPPTRLIDVHHVNPRLVLSSHLNINHDLTYATLSHCWGKKPFPTLNKATLSQFLVEIPKKALTKTFRDAIYIARYLGFRFLWIDSLCIIQDDSDDWGREASTMANVYGNSDLNISANSAVDGSVGCFFRRPKTWRCNLRLGTLRTAEVVNIGFPDPPIEANPLHTRAWVLQERYLPPRTISFYEQQVYWSCCSRQCCEAFPHSTSLDKELKPFLVADHKLVNRPLGEDFVRREQSTSLGTTLNISLTDNISNAEAHKLWQNIVETYSKTQITYRIDRLVAIAGIARHSYFKNLGEYLAGMWREDLELHLGWRPASSTVTSGSGDTAYIAPSWAWIQFSASQGVATARFGTAWQTKRKHLRVRVLKAEVLHASSDPFGRVAGGFIQLQCDILIHARLTVSRPGSSVKLLFNSGTSWDQVYGLDDYTEKVKDMKVLNVPIQLSKTKEYVGDYVHVLILRPTALKHGQYRRIGMYSRRLYEGDRKDAEYNWKQLTEEFNRQENMANASDCLEIMEDNEGNRHYVIEII